MSSVDPDPHYRFTFRLDLLRAIPSGALLTVGTTFAILFANQIFAAPDWAKGLLLASSSVGMLAGIWAVTMVRRTGISMNQGVALLSLVEVCGFGVAALSGAVDGGWAMGCFVFGVSLAMFCTSLAVPLMAQIYRSGYPDSKRGQLFSLSAMVRSAAAIAVAWMLGEALAGDMSRYTLALGLFAASALVNGWCVLAMPRSMIQRRSRAPLFEAFSHVREDKPFMKLLSSWMILGFGNLMAFAMFVEAVANPKYGYAFNADRVTLLTTTIPQVALVVCVFAWGRLFDRWNFYLLRLCINVVFIAGVIMYYCVGSWWGLCVGIALHGVARSGGNIAWSLWTTKFASADRVADYMSVHTFATGIRGVVAPFVALGVAGSFSLEMVGLASASLMTIASVMILPDVKLALARRKSHLVVPPRDGS